MTSAGFVYFAAFDENPFLVKVGWSRNPWRRVREFRRRGQCARVLTTIQVDAGSAMAGVRADSLEKRAHRYLSAHRIDPSSGAPCPRGEWYFWPTFDVHDLEEQIRALKPGAVDCSRAAREQDERDFAEMDECIRESAEMDAAMRGES